MCYVLHVDRPITLLPFSRHPFLYEAEHWLAESYHTLDILSAERHIAEGPHIYYTLATQYM